MVNWKAQMILFLKNILWFICIIIVQGQVRDVYAERQSLYRKLLGIDHNSKSSSPSDSSGPAPATPFPSIFLAPSRVANAKSSLDSPIANAANTNQGSLPSNSGNEQWPWPTPPPANAANQGAPVSNSDREQWPWPTPPPLPGQRSKRSENARIDQVFYLASIIDQIQSESKLGENGRSHLVISFPTFPLI